MLYFSIYGRRARFLLESVMHNWLQRKTISNQNVQTKDALFEHRAHGRWVSFVIAGFVLVVVMILSLGIGRTTIAPNVVVGILAHNWFDVAATYTESQQMVVMAVRLPRILAAVLVGGALALAGAAYQGLFRNPMVSPDILGASTGASFGAAFAILWGFSIHVVQFSAFLCGFGAVVVTMLLSRFLSHGRSSILTLVLCGMVVGTLFQSLVSLVKFTADPDSKLPEITYWLMGSIAKVTWDDLVALSIPVVIGVVPIVLVRWRLNTLAFGEDAAASLGVNVRGLRTILIVCATLLTACVVAMAGVVGWVGLIVPHMARFLGGSDNRAVIPLSLLSGGAFLLIVDTACRTLMASELPLGILTSVIGAPFFIAILARTRQGERL